MRDTSQSHGLLKQLTSLLGDYYGSSEICFQLYSIVKMNNPKVVVELGSGLGISTLWMALGLEEQNKNGTLWSLDDFSLFPRFLENASEDLRIILQQFDIDLSADMTGEKFISKLASSIGLQKKPVILNDIINLDDPLFFDKLNFHPKSIDLLFSDFDSSPGTLIQLLIHVLPRMSETSSLLIDSVPTLPTSYHLLTSIINQLNNGHIPKTIKDFLSKDQVEVVLDRKYTLINLTYNPEGHQCGTSWIKIEPYDIFPHPRVPMRP